MTGTVRFESTSGSPEELGFSGNYTNGQRGNHPGASFDRSGSFREGTESRVFSSGSGLARGYISTSMGELPPLSQSLMLEPIAMGDQKSRCGELRRVLGLSFGSAAEDNSFGAAHAKPTLPVTTEELRRFKASVVDASVKARGRAKMLDESLNKLSKYCEALNSKKHQRNEIPTNERSGGSNLLKTGTQIQRNPPDVVTQRLEDRTKSFVLNKRSRTSIAEIRSEGRNNALPRQPLVIGKDRDMRKDDGNASDMVEEKIRKLPAGGEGWDKKMKRKRSVGSVFIRSVDGDGDLKRPMHQKLSNGSGLQSCDAQGFRSGSLNGASGINKLDSTSLSTTSTVRGTAKNELEKVSLPRDLSAGLNNQRLVSKGNNKLNIREGNHAVGPSPVPKGKGSRAPRTGPVAVPNSSSNFSRSSGSFEEWEQHQNVDKVQGVVGANNRKRPMPTESLSPPMAQWVGQRPPKNSRTRRANLVSPVSNLDEMQTSSEGCAASDFGARITSSGSNVSLLARSAPNGTQQLKVKLENVLSPARLSESEESGAGENKLKEKGTGGGEVEERSVNGGRNVGPSLLLTKKNKTLRDGIEDGVRRQGRSGRGSPFPRASISPMREKLGTQSPTKPLRSSRPGSDKNGSKSGRPPLKKLSDRKSLTRLAQTPSCGSPYFMGDSDDDREEVLAAAKFASNASYLACSSSFWKKMERIFGFVSLGDISYLEQQIKFAEELHESLSQMFGHGDNLLGDFLPEESSQFQAVVSGERVRSLLKQVGLKKSGRTMDLDDDFLEHEVLFGRIDTKGRPNEVPPLYQRVLSALIVEDEAEEFEEDCGGRDVSFRYVTDDSPSTCLHIDVESIKRDGMELEYKSMLGLQIQRERDLDRPSCNGNYTFKMGPIVDSPLCNDELSQQDGCTNPELGWFPEFPQNDLAGPQSLHMTLSSVSWYDGKYEQMHLEDKLLFELQSIGLYPEAVPDLAEGEEEVISQEIVQLKKGLHQLAGKKKAQLCKLHKGIQELKEVEEQVLDQIALNRLTEMAYTKYLATRGSNASKSGVTKVAKQAALAFVKRTLFRCHKYEDTGKSCFMDAPVREVLLAAPPCVNDEKSIHFIGATNVHHETHNSQQQDSRVSGSFTGRDERHGAYETVSHSSDQAFAKNGPISNRGKKKEVLLDDVGGNAALRATSSLGNTLLGSVKGKRSEREREKDALSRSSVAKAGRLSLGNCKGERKTKSKPKQKIALLAAHTVNPSGSVSSELASNVNKNKREVGLMSSGNTTRDTSKEHKDPFDFTNLHEIDSIEELGVGNEFGGNQDFGSWLNFDEDGLQDHDSMGLDIPMDDLSELNMF